jgi:integrase
MGNEEPTQSFQTYLSQKTDISDSTANGYKAAVSLFIKKYPEPTMDNVNEFLRLNYKRKRNYPYRYALRHYFISLGREKEFENGIIKIKRKRMKKEPGVYLEKTRLLSVINNIEEEKLRLVAFMQMYSGCRSYEILKLQWKHIRTDKAIHVMETKSKKLRVVRVPDSILNKVLEMKPQNAKKDDFIFWDSKIKERSLYRRYLYKLHKAAGIVLGEGMRMGTHDFRRNFARAAHEFYKKDLVKVKDAMGHSDISQTMTYIGEIAADKKKLAEGIYGEEGEDD